MGEKHIVLRTAWCNNMEHGILRDLENVISEMTGAVVMDQPPHEVNIPGFIKKRLGHGQRLDWLRGVAASKKIDFECDFLWVPLMGPEDYQLDLFKGWGKNAKFKILYLCDTFPRQNQVIKYIVRHGKFDLLITAFEGSVPELNRVCGRKWFGVTQGVRLERFYPRQPEAQMIPPIHIVSYGRRDKNFHQDLLRFCAEKNLWYDYTSVKNRELEVPVSEYYQHYAQHLGSSLISVNWPVEMTHPERAGGISPITCRWFEAAASGCVIVGRAPSDPTFERFFGPNLVHPVPQNTGQVKGWLEELVVQSKQYREAALAARDRLKEQWSWQSRVRDMIELTKKE